MATKPTDTSAVRAIRLKTSGRKMGPVMRLIDPGDIGEITKPFVFLDDAEIPPGPGTAMNWHPHSGVGALTIITSGQNRYKETTGKQGSVAPDGIEGMASGKGVWHAASAIGDTNLIGYQVWMLLPPEAELAPSYSRHFTADEIEMADRVRVILGSWQGRRGPVPYDNAATLLDVRRKAGETFEFTIEPGHKLAWIAVHSGSVSAGGETIRAGELAVFEDGAEPIAIRPRLSWKPAGEERTDRSFPCPHSLIARSYQFSPNGRTSTSKLHACRSRVCSDQAVSASPAGETKKSSGLSPIIERVDGWSTTPSTISRPT